MRLALSPTLTPDIAPGFADPVMEAQAVFRATLDALAEPGSERAVGGIATAPSPLSPVAAALVATLADYETTLWRDAPLRSPSIDGWLAFHTGAPASDDPGRAAFAVVAEVAALAPYDAFHLGSDVDPSTSTTVILQVAGFAGGRRYRLAGPGIDGHRDILVEGGPQDLAARASANRALYPRGVDLILAGPHSVIGLPRTTRIEEI